MMSLKRARDYSVYPLPISKYRRTGYINSPSLSRMSSYFGRSNTSYRSRFSSRAGPYRTLTATSRHTNPIYPRPELKFYDSDPAGTSPPQISTLRIDSGGTVACLNRLITGTGVQNFLGNQISVKSVSYRVELNLPSASADQVPTSGRVVLLWDKQPNGTLPTFSTIFQTNSYLAYINNNYRDRFVVLRNDQFSLSPNGDQALFFERNVKINMLTTFANGQSTAGVPQTGALLLAYVGDQSTQANQPTINGWFRLRYYDN